MKTGVIASVILACALPVSAGEPEQLPGGIGGAVKRVQQFKELQVTPQEEQELGALVSQRVRERYGVVQDANVHRYIALVGSALVAVSTRPKAEWTYIVLDTDAVNAFAAPGGFVHITRGALALIHDESELAGVLAHEIVHVTEQHTINAMKKNKAIQMGADETLSGNAALLNRVAEQVYLDIIEKGFGRGEENESDEKGVTMANSIGYAPAGLRGFLVRLQERNKESKEKRGLFASHPAMKERLDRITKQITAQKLSSTATLADRYKKFITYTPVAMTSIATVAPGSAGLAGGETAAKPAAKAEEKKEEPPKKKGGFGLGRLLPAGGGEKQSAQASASGGARMVDPEVDAKGGGNPKPVPVKIGPADIASFKKEGGLK